MSQRTIERNIKDRIGSGKAIIIVEARQVGKTTLIKKSRHNKEHKSLVRKLLNNILF